MLIRSMSALDSPPRLCFNHRLKADGVEGGSTHAFRTLSGQCLVMAGGWSDVSLPLYSACCLHVAAVAAAGGAGGGVVPAASCRILGVAAAEETGGWHVKQSLSVMQTWQWILWEFSTLWGMLSLRLRKERRIAVQSEFIFVKHGLYIRRFSFQAETFTIWNLMAPSEEDYW